MPRELEFFVPSNRKRRDGTPNHMDGMNEIVGSGLTNRNFAARRKRENTRWVAGYAASAAQQQGWEMPDRPVVVSLEWHEVNAMRDIDNIAGGAKYVLDALGKPSRWSDKEGAYTRNPFGAGVIRDDNQRCVVGLNSTQVIDRANPGVMVRIEVVED